MRFGFNKINFFSNKSYNKLGDLNGVERCCY